MRILISNDDGVYAPGLLALHTALAECATCQVVAPDRDRSGASSALTLDRPLHAHYLDNGFISIDGTPADSVHLALYALLQEQPDMLVSGINLGANLGDDVRYSGTVAAAFEGRFLRRPALAISLAARTPEHFATAAWWARHLVLASVNLIVPPRTVLNVNVPSLPLNAVRGVVHTRLGQRSQASAPMSITNPRGKQGYWIAAAGDPQDEGLGTDFHAVRQGYVSITPLQLDSTASDIASALEAWLEQLP